MSRAFRQTLERLALLIAGLMLGQLLFGDPVQTASDDEREANWVAGYRRGQADYRRALRKANLLPGASLFAEPAEPGG